MGLVSEAKSTLASMTLIRYEEGYYCKPNHAEICDLGQQNLIERLGDGLGKLFVFIQVVHGNSFRE